MAFFFLNIIASKVIIIKKGKSKNKGNSGIANRDLIIIELKFTVHAQNKQKAFGELFTWTLFTGALVVVRLMIW